MKSKEQKRLEAADRLDELARKIDCGERWEHLLPVGRQYAANRRRNEASRLRALRGSR